MAVQRHSLFQNNLIDVIINSKTWASAQQRLVVKVGFIMLTFGKPTCRSHFWMWSSSSAFFTALSPTKHVSCFTFFLLFSVGGKHGDIKSSEVKVEQLQTGKATQTQDAQDFTCSHIQSTLASCTFCYVAWCVWKTLKLKGQNHQYQSQMVNGGFPSMSRNPWRENNIGVDIFLINLWHRKSQLQKHFWSIAFPAGSKINRAKWQKKNWPAAQEQQYYIV